MRWGPTTTILFATMLFATFGCKGASGSGAPSTESTSGGESSAGSGKVAGDAGDTQSETNAAANPWGATQAEQCRRTALPTISPKAKKALDEGVRAAARNDSGAAAASFEQALQKDPGAYAALYNLGVLADRAGREQDAIHHYRRALQVLPDYEPAVRGITAIQIRQGQVQEAVTTVEPLANRYRANLELQALYAEVLVEASRVDEAWMAARRALKCDERFVPALVALVKASRAQGRDELAESILAQALEIDPDVAELHFLLGEKLESEPGELREAMAAYERAVELRPDYAEARMALGVRLLAGGNYPGALAHFQVAQQIVPTLAAVHVNLGDAYRATKQWADASHSYRRALELQPKLPEAHYGLGLLFLTAAGDFPGLDEVSAYEKAVHEFKAYRNEMGPRLAKDDQSAEYLLDLDRLIKRARRRTERNEGGAS